MAKTHVVGGLNVSDLVAAEADSSVVDGDIMLLPPGSVTWTSGFSATKNLTWTGPAVNSGNNSRGTLSATIINFNNDGTSPLNVFDLATTSCWLQNVKITTNNSTSGVISCVRVQGQNVRISNCYFVATVNKQIGVLVTGGTGIPHPTGVCWWSTFEGCRPADSEGDLGPSGGDRIWANSDQPWTWGSQYNWFTEDCSVNRIWATGQNLWDHAEAAHSVIRYNTIQDGNIEFHGFNSFPPFSSFIRGSRGSEIYNNTIAQVNLSMGQAPIWVNGGSALVYNNTITGNWSAAPGPKLDYPFQPARYGNQVYDGNQPVTNGTGTASANNAGGTVLTDGTQNWTSNSWNAAGYVYNLTDGSNALISSNTSTTVTSAALSGGATNQWHIGDSYKITQGYPLRDQPGTGTDSQIHTGSPGSGTYYPQLAMGCWENNNTLNGSPVHWIINASFAYILQQNRDYYQSQLPPGYVAYPYPHPLRAIRIQGKHKTCVTAYI